MPLAGWLLCCTVNRSKSRSGLNPARFTVIVSFSLPRTTVAVTVGVLPGAFAQPTVAVFGNSLNVVECTFAFGPAAAIAAGTMIANAASTSRTPRRPRRLRTASIELTPCEFAGPSHAARPANRPHSATGSPGLVTLAV